MNWRTEDAIFKRFMAGESIANLAEWLCNESGTNTPRATALIEQAIRNAIRRRARQQEAKKGGER